MKRALRFLVAALALAIGGGSVQSQAQVQSSSADGVWQATANPPAGLAPRTNIAGAFATVLLNKEAFDARLAGAPREDEPNAGAGVEFTLPMPDGKFARFTVLESPMLAPELAAAFPQIRTYRGQGIDDPTATARFGWTDLGFHAIVISSAATSYVDPYVSGNLDYYIAYGKQPKTQPWSDLVDGEEDPFRVVNEFPIVNGGTLRTYRLALAATVEYTTAAGGTKPLAAARMATSMNRVNGIYERELAVRMTLATGTPADPTALIFTAEPDGYTNNNGSTMLGENTTKLNAVVGVGNYDVGHVFSTGGGGVATLNGPCGANKARGVTGLSNPVGDAFDVDFVAHEMGHQFGGRHTFNGQTGSCSGGNRDPAHAFEVGSGNTIQAYAGICGVEDLQKHSNDYFHFESLNEMTAFLTTGGGQTCGTAVATGNTPPTVSAPAAFTIPRNTPFALTAGATDPNADTLTYTWEEYDLGTASTSVLSASTDDGLRPLFRSYAPTTSGTRVFPSLPFILNNANVPPTTFTCPDGAGTCLRGEVLPSLARAAMRFQVTARDNRAGGGGIGTALSTLSVHAGAGPFNVTAPNTAVSFVGGTPQTISWSVNNTNVPPVNTTSVRISLSTDGGLTFPTVILASTANDGSEVVAIPNAPTTTARIKVEAVGNIFFDISDTNFTITAGTTPPGVGAPTNFAASVAGSNVTFTWTPGSGTLPITGYLLEGGVTPGGVLGSVPIPAGSSFSSPLPTGAFYIRLYALSGATRSVVSNEIRIFVNVPPPPSAPTNLLGLVNGSGIGLSWINTTGGGPPTGVILDVTGSITASLPLPLSETFSVPAGVPPGTYTFRMRTTNGTGASDPSAPVTLTFPGACSGAPQVPVGFLLSKAGTILSLSWLPPASGAAATSYNVIVSGAFTGTVPFPFRAATASVAPGTYTISIAATNSCGVGPSTAPQTITIP